MKILLECGDYFKKLVKYQPQNTGPDKKNYTYNELKGQFVDLDIKVIDNTLFRSRYFGNKPVTLDKLESLGVREIRLLVSWSAVAPSPSSAVRPAGDLTNPSAYGWGPYPAIVAAARAHGISTEVTIAGPAPRWGTQGARDQITYPRPSDYQHFVTAIARRLKGQVALWTVWNEPNFRTFLMPQLVKGKPASPAIYRGLFLAAVAGMKAAGQPGAKLLIGETAPRSGAGGVAPLAFLRGLLCLDGRYHPIKARHCAPLPAYGWAHHPYAPAAGPFFVPAGRDDVTIGSLSRLTSALGKAVKAHALTSSRLFLTEFGVQSYPDKLAGVPLDKQSDYRSISEKLAWNNPHVYGFSQYLLQDDKIGSSPGDADAGIHGSVRVVHGFAGRSCAITTRTSCDRGLRALMEHGSRPC